MINFSLNAQNVGIGSSNFTPDNSAGLEIKFTDKGLLIPRVLLLVLQMRQQYHHQPHRY